MEDNQSRYRGSQQNSLPKLPYTLCGIIYASYSNTFGILLHKDNRLVVSCDQLCIDLHSFCCHCSHICRASICHHLHVDSDSTLHFLSHSRECYLYGITYTYCNIHIIIYLIIGSEPWYTNLTLGWDANGI